VFATGNSVAVPAILPDGSVAPESISAIIDATPIEESEKPAADAHALTGGPYPEDEK
jgi:NADH-quinone oxidoreductase subunit J